MKKILLLIALITLSACDVTTYSSTSGFTSSSDSTTSNQIDYKNNFIIEGIHSCIDLHYVFYGQYFTYDNNPYFVGGPEYYTLNLEEIDITEYESLKDDQYISRLSYDDSYFKMVFRSHEPGTENYGEMNLGTFQYKYSTIDGNNIRFDSDLDNILDIVINGSSVYYCLTYYFDLEMPDFYAYLVFKVA